MMTMHMALALIMVVSRVCVIASSNHGNEYGMNDFGRSAVPRVPRVIFIEHPEGMYSIGQPLNVISAPPAQYLINFLPAPTLSSTEVRMGLLYRLRNMEMRDLFHFLLFLTKMTFLLAFAGLFVFLSLITHYMFKTGEMRLCHEHTTVRHHLSDTRFMAVAAPFSLLMIILPFLKCFRSVSRHEWLCFGLYKIGLIGIWVVGLSQAFAVRANCYTSLQHIIIVVNIYLAIIVSVISFIATDCFGLGNALRDDPFARDAPFTNP